MIYNRNMDYEELRFEYINTVQRQLFHRQKWIQIPLFILFGALSLIMSGILIGLNVGLDQKPFSVFYLIPLLFPVVLFFILYTIVYIRSVKSGGDNPKDRVLDR